MNFEKQDNNYRSYKGFNLNRTDPFGFWEVRTFDNKAVPIKEKFTTTRDAVNAIEGYLNKIAKEDKKKR